MTPRGGPRDHGSTRRAQPVDRPAPAGGPQTPNPELMEKNMNENEARP